MSRYLVTFTDGPAKGQQLDLARAPLFLRVVRGIDGKWDALDLLEDTVALGDEIFIYALGAKMGHVRYPRETYWMVEYEATDEIPAEGMDDPYTWQAAASAAAAKRREEEADARQPA